MLIRHYFGKDYYGKQCWKKECAVFYYCLLLFCLEFTVVPIPLGYVRCQIREGFYCLCTAIVSQALASATFVSRDAELELTRMSLQRVAEARRQ